MKFPLKFAVINKKNIYQQIDFTGFPIFKIGTFASEIPMKYERIKKD